MSLGIYRELILDGVDVVSGFLSTEECTGMRTEVMGCLESIDMETTKEHDAFFFVNNMEKKERPGNLGLLSKPAIVRRGSSGYDIGMVDIFRANELFKSIPVDKMNTVMKNVMKGLGFDRIKTEFSVYHNKGIRKIRGFHRDVPLAPSSKKLFKFFVYLTDVPTIDYGPYCYLRGTHLPDTSLDLSRQIKGEYRDPNEYDFDLDPFICRGSAGTLIMSNQGGMHRGMPQLADKERLALVCKARPL